MEWDPAPPSSKIYTYLGLGSVNDIFSVFICLTDMVLVLCCMETQAVTNDKTLVISKCCGFFLNIVKKGSLISTVFGFFYDRLFLAF